MKNIILILMLCLSFMSITSCGDDNSTDKENPIKNDPNTPVTVASEWEPTTIQLIKIIPLYTLQYPHTTGCTKDHLQLMSNNSAKFFRYTDSNCTVTEYANAFVRNGNNVTVNLLGYTVTGTLEETSNQMIVSSNIDEYSALIKAEFPEYEQYLGMLSGGTVKLTLQKK